MSADAARSFLDAVAGYTDNADAEVPSQDKPVRLGTIDALYTGSGNPKVLFDGESLMGVRTYPWIGRQPVASERVVLIPQGHTYVVAGTIGTLPGSEYPVGSYIDGAWASAPAGFLMCDGSVQLRATYARLFAVIGTTYNTGGETGSQFRLPDLRNRTKVGKGASGTFGTLGAAVGAETVQLTAAESGLPAHWHEVGLDGDGNGTIDAQIGQQVTGPYTAWRFDVAAAGGTVLRKFVAGPNAAQAAASAHNNVQPSRVVNTAIKY
jgi:microcystin-dependent protein